VFSLSPDVAITQVRVESPARAKGGGGRGRRDSDVARRHAFHFPFDFLLAAGSCAVVKWGPERGPDAGDPDANTFRWQRPLDFDASDVVAIAFRPDGGDDDGGGDGDEGGGAAGAAVGGLGSPYSRAGARLGGWGGGGGDDDDPDAALKAGALCLVDPEGAVSHAVRLLPQEALQEQPPPPGAASSGGAGRRRVTYAAGSLASPWASNGSPEMTAESFWQGAAAAAMATPRRLGERFAAAMEPSGRRWGHGGRPVTTPLPEPAVPDKCAVM
jgi:hypothetical protein